MSDEINVNSENTPPRKNLATLGQVKDALDKRDKKIDSLKEELNDKLDRETADTLYAPIGSTGGEGGGSGSNVSVEAIQTTGVHIADITVDGVTTELFAPIGSADGEGGNEPSEPITYTNLVDPSSYKNSGYGAPYTTWYDSNSNVFDGLKLDNAIRVGDNKYMYYRLYRANQISNPDNCGVRIACFDTDKNHIVTYCDNGKTTTGESHSLITKVSSTFDPSGIETVGTEIVYLKAFVRFEIPDGTSYVKVAVRGNGDFKPVLYPALWVSFDNITNYGSITDNDLLPVIASEEETPSGGTSTGGTSTGGTGGVTASAYKPLLNKTMVMIGDSLTNWGGGTDTADGFLKLIHTNTGINTLNQGLAGAHWEKASGQTWSAVQRVDALVSANVPYDLVVFLMGTNWGTTGNVSDAPSNADNGSVCSAVKYCFEKLMQWSPSMPILVALPPKRLEGNETQKANNAILKEICEMYGIQTVDLWSCGQIVPNNIVDGTGGLGDGLHLGEVGKAHVGRVLSSAIRSVMGY